MSKLQAGGVLDLIALSKAENKLGDVKQSMLTLEEFNSQHLGQWMLMNGQSCAGTAYATLTGKTTVPDMVTNATFIRQASGARQLGSYEADENKAHKHIEATGGVNSNLRYGHTTAAASNRRSESGTSGDFASYTETVGAAEARPKNIALNHFIKVGY